MKENNELIVQKNQKKTFGQTVQECRTRRGWTQGELAWRSDINRTHLGRIERDECIPTITTIERLEEALGLPHLSLVELKHSEVVQEKGDESTETEVSKAFRDLEHELVMNMSEEDLKSVSSALNAFTELIKK